MKLFYLIFIFQILAACSSVEKSGCLENRGALDVGSGSTKILVAQVDVCQNSIVKNLFSEQVPIGFSEALEKSSDQTLGEEILTSGGKQIAQLVNKAKGFKPKRIRAAATAVFRKAKNGTLAAQSLSKIVGVEIPVVSQETETELGILSALTQKKLNLSEKKVGIWDIGGGSMQISILGSSEDFRFGGTLASVSFKNQVISQLKNKNPKKVESPNPLGRQSKAAVRLAERHAASEVPPEVKAHATSARWLGIGGVHWHSIRGQTGKNRNEISQKDIVTALNSRSKLSDKELGGKFASTDVTNLALVLGYMRALKIKSYEPVEASLVQGLLLP